MISKLILGTVQLGLSYGINNELGKPSIETAFDILNLAYNSGIRIFDTAEAYGDSQEIIGAFIKEYPEKDIKIITKLSANNSLKQNELIKHIQLNCNLLNIKKLEAYMFHNYESFKKSIFLYEEIIEAKKERIIKNAGISLYTNKEIEDIIDNYPQFDFIQIPFNLFDNEIKRKSVIEKAKSKKIKIHVRSAFLQGLFFKKLDTIQGKLLSLKPYLIELDAVKKEYKISTETLALQYVLQKQYIDKVLIGVDSVEQLQKNIDICSKKVKIPSKVIDKIEVLEKELLNPSNW